MTMKVLLYGYKMGGAIAALYNGFSKIIGSSNVFVTADGIERYLRAPGKTDRFTLYKKPPSANLLSDEEALERADDFDQIFFFHDAFFNKNAYTLLNRPSGSTKSFFDDRDDFFVRSIYLHKEIKHYFKREVQRHFDSRHIPWTGLHVYGMVKGKWILHSGFDREAARFVPKAGIPIGIAIDGMWRKVHPFPVVMPDPIKHSLTPKDQRNYDVSFMGNLNNYLRKRYYNYAKSLADSGYMKGYFSGSHIDYKAYTDVLRHSKAGLSLKAFGEDAWRYWETVYEGAMLLSHRTLLVIPDNYVDGESAVFFDTREEMKEKIGKYILKSDEWYEIARNGNRHFWKYHVPENRVKELIIKYVA